MSEQERIKQLKELLKLKEELLNPKDNNSVNQNKTNQSSKVKTLVNPTTGNVKFTEPDLDNKKAAYSSLGMLSFIVLLFESLFLFLSYVIFK